MNPREVKIGERIIVGISARTKNSDEMKSDLAKLPNLWGKFYQEGLMNKIPGKVADSAIYGVYHSYESDLHGEYTLLAGVEADAEAPSYSTKKIESGKYLLFEGKGEMPQVVINLWQEIWKYFESPDAPTRAYLTDFELYKSPTEVDIYVGIK